MKLKPLIIGDLKIEVPIVQGGMGIGISLSSLASSVSSYGGLGVIAVAGIGFLENDFSSNPLAANLRALKKHISIAKEKSHGAPIGVNIMTALNHYGEFVKCCVESGVDIIFSGAGLPIHLPELVEGSKTKIAPIVSSEKAADIIMKMWQRRYNRLPDAIVVEGPKAGGHLGFSPDELETEIDFSTAIQAIIHLVKQYEQKWNLPIPTIVGGGIFDKDDVQNCFDLGASGVQVSTKFVTTEECDAHENFKNAYVRAKKEDIGIVKSPVGMPGRAIFNEFMKNTLEKKQPISNCVSCITKCDKKTIPYCITTALINSAKGNVAEGLIFCGENAWKLDKITTVKEVFNTLL